MLIVGGPVWRVLHSMAAHVETSVDPHQGSLFATAPLPADLASAGHLREAASPVAHSGEEPSPVTLAHARRQAEMSAALRAERDRWARAIAPAYQCSTTYENDAREREQAHQRREHADRHHHQLNRTLGRDHGEALDAGR